MSSDDGILCGVFVVDMDLLFYRRKKTGNISRPFRGGGYLAISDKTQS